MRVLGENIRAIWIATNARTGSMWTTNVVAAIVRAEGHAVVPENLGEKDEKARTIQAMEHLESGARGVAVIKSHKAVPVVPDSVGVITLRDIRDVTVSFMRFMRLPFEECLPFVETSLARTPDQLYAGEDRILLEHEVIADRPVEAVRYLAQQLGAKTAEQAATEIAERFSKAVVSRIAADADADVKARLKARERVLRNEVTIVRPDNWRARDRETSFQTGHVSDYKAGDWKHILTPEQQAVLDALIKAAGRSVV
jgi:hypothetical protein